MSKIGTSVARKDVGQVQDEIWRITCRNEVNKARDWEKKYDHLIPQEKKGFLARLEKERKEKQNIAKSDNTHCSQSINPHISELTLTPDPPQRKDQRDKYYMRQNPLRDNTKSKMLKYYNLTIPPNKVDPNTTQAMNFQKEYKSYEGTEFVNKEDEKAKTSDLIEQAEELVKSQFRKLSPRTRYNGQKKATSNDYGWLQNVELAERSKHGLKSMRFE